MLHLQLLMSLLLLLAERSAESHHPQNWRDTVVPMNHPSYNFLCQHWRLNHFVVISKPEDRHTHLIWLGLIPHHYDCWAPMILACQTCQYCKYGHPFHHELESNFISCSQITDLLLNGVVWIYQAKISYQVCNGLNSLFPNRVLRYWLIRVWKCITIASHSW